MAEEILSQDEVDALLKGVLGEAEEEVPQTDDSAVRTYDIGKQERIVRGRMPTLEIINERFARMFRIGLFNFMRRSAEISVSPVKVPREVNPQLSTDPQGPRARPHFRLETHKSSGCLCLCGQ